MTVLSSRVIERQLPNHLEKLTLTVSGVVTGIPQKEQGEFSKTTFDFNVLSGGKNQSCESTDPSILNGKIRLSWSDRYAGKSQQHLKPVFFDLSPGQSLCLTVRLRRPRGQSNPGGFDYHRWLLSNGYVATGYITDIVNAPDKRNPSIVDQVRWNVYLFFQNHISDSKRVGSFWALSLGEKSGVTQEQWQLLRSTGTLHLLVISGLHVGIIAALGFLVGHILARLIGWKMGVYPVWIAPIISIVLVAGYVMLAGFSLPTQRAFIMALTANTLLATGRINRVWLGYWLSMIVCLLIDPLAAHGTGFWLSFGVVAVILSGLSRYNSARPILSFFMLQIRIFLCMALPLGFLTSGFSLTGLVVNFVAIPYISFVVVPLVLLTSVSGLVWENSLLASGLVQLSGLVIDGFWAGLRASENFADWVLGLNDRWLITGFLEIPTLQISSHHWLLASLAVVLLLIPLVTTWQRIILVSSVCIALFFSNGQMHFAQMIVFDVGQGLSSVTQVDKKTLVYDTGPPLGDDRSQAEQVLVPYLLKSNIQRIDQLMLSHGDSDHASGLLALAEQFHLPSVVSSEPDRLPISAGFCERGQRWQWASSLDNLGAEFEVLWPLNSKGDLVLNDVHSSSDIYSSNDKSCVLLIKIGDLHILHTGDISKSIEWELVRLGLPDIDVLIAPHHGSQSSSSVRFLLATQPEHIIFSTGYLNRYRHPSTQVVSRIKKHLPDSMLWNTATDGAIHIAIDDEFDWQIYASRKINRRYWHSLE